MSLYPMTVRLSSEGRDAVEIAVVIDRDGWRFAGTLYRALFETLPASERLNLRRQFAAQVALATNTPTKGDAT